MSQVIALPDGSGGLELTDARDGHVGRIRCRDADGTVRWEALPPDGVQDSWTSVEVEAGTVIGRSWSCWRVEIELISGKEISRQFTK
jgi:hypothetical protein